MNDGLKEKNCKTIISILASNERVERVVLFGSRAMETFSPESDVDLILYGVTPLPLRIELFFHGKLTRQRFPSVLS